MLNDGAPIPRLRTALRARLGDTARGWLDEALAEADRAPGGPGRPAAPAEAVTGARPAEPVAGPVPRPPRPPAWELRFAAAGRHCGRKALAAPAAGSGAEDDGTSADGGRFDLDDPADAARVLLLHAARATGATAARLYTHGTAAERRAVLRALPYLGVGAEALHLVEDALRTHDTRLVGAALGPYAAHHLDPHAWRHAILKCLFTEVPVTAVADLSRRARGDAELARMLTDYARERTAAGRAVPADLYRVLALATGAATSAVRAERPGDRPGPPEPTDSPGPIGNPLPQES